MEAVATIRLDDTTTEEYLPQEPLESGSPPPLVVDEGEVGSDVVTLNEDDEDVHATMAKSLPQYVIIQTNFNNIYLRYDNGWQPMPDNLRFHGEYSFGLETRFELVPATTGNGLIHIRCLHNNKYWAPFFDGGLNGNWITANAIKPVENQSDRHCTLFRPVFLNSNGVLRLRNVNTGNFVSRTSGVSVGSLTLLPKSFPNEDEFIFIDWKSVVVLPDRIRIKNNGNGNHLKARSDEYIDMRNKADNSSEYDYEVFPSRNGGIRLKSVVYDKVWTEQNSTYVLLKHASSNAGLLPNHTTDTVFLPIALGSNRTVLRCLKSGLLCTNYSVRNRPAWRDLLATRANHPDDSTYMEIEEPVVSRTISNVRYRLTDARIYGENVLALISKDSTNRTQEPNRTTLDLRYLESRTSTWHASVSFTYGVTATARFGVPILKEGRVEVSWEFNGQYEWGETVQREIEVGTMHEATVPSMTRVRVTLMATQGSYDIPFSYTQRDVLSNGNTKVYEKDDGLFTGGNGYNYQYKSEQFDL